MNESKVTSAAEWMALPEIDVPIIGSTAETGSVFMVHKVGFLLADVADCQDAKIDGPLVEMGKGVLPTATVDQDNQRNLYRLPLALGEWVFSCVAMAQRGVRPFPCNVEFGSIDGHMYAEML